MPWNTVYCPNAISAEEDLPEAWKLGVMDEATMQTNSERDDAAIEERMQDDAALEEKCFPSE
jgi:hypothetical protein